jgi:hypothetical protein
VRAVQREVGKSASLNRQNALTIVTVMCPVTQWPRSFKPRLPDSSYPHVGEPWIISNSRRVPG